MFIKILAGFLLFLSLCPIASANTYQLIDLGTLGGNYSQATSINDSQQITGWSRSVPPPGTGDRGYVWNNGVMTSLGTLGATSYGYGISESGYIAGTTYVNIGGGSVRGRAFLWDAGVMQNLGTLGGDFSQGSGVNDSQEVVGFSRTATGQTHAFLWDSGVMTDLTPTASYSQATAINNVGQVTGSTNGIAGDAFIWDPVTGMTIIGSGAGLAINNLGHVAGFYGAGTEFHGFLWNGTVQMDLGTLWGRSDAYGLNDLGQVVGRSGDSSGYHAFIWENGLMLDLNNMINPGLGWELNYAYDINNNGDIVGLGTIAGETHAFLLTTVPIPTALFLFIPGLAGLVTLAWRGRREPTA